MQQVITFFILLSLSSTSFAEVSVADLQRDWAIANYELQDDSQSEAFEELILRATEAIESDPGNAELLIWKAIIESTYAGTAGLAALGLVKAAKRDLEAAMELDAMALNGSAYTSLGALYYQVPPWPIAFGSSKKARKLLEKAIEVDPAGIDSNYFYGAFLVDEKEYEPARQALQKAMAAPDRPGRELADKGRRAEIMRLLAEVDRKR